MEAGVIANALNNFGCDVSKKLVTYGKDWYHQVGSDFDLCAEEYEKLSEDARKAYVFVDSIDALKIVFEDAKSSDTKNVGTKARLARIVGESLTKGIEDRESSGSSMDLTELLQALHSTYDEEEDAGSDTIRLVLPVKDRIINSARSVAEGKSPLVLAVVGDKGVGKSSVLWCWKNCLPVGAGSDVPEIMKAVLTDDTRAIISGMKMMCIDTKGVDPSSEEVVEDPLKRSVYGRAHAIALVIDSTESESLRRVSHYWLREFDYYNVSPAVPIFVMGHRGDIPVSQADSNTLQPLVGDLLDNVSRRFASPFWAVTSARRVDQIEEVMKRVQCAVLYPPCLVIRKARHVHGDSAEGHGHSHDGQACGHSHQASNPSADQHGHSHSGEQHKHDNQQQAGTPAHGHSHNGQPCDHNHAETHGKSGKKAKGKGREDKRTLRSASTSQALNQIQSMGVRLALIRALATIFDSLDHDKDGILNERQMTELQMRAFGHATSLAEIRAQMQDSVTKQLINNKGISFPAFLIMLVMGAMQGRTDVVWKVLLGYGYDYDPDWW